MAYLKMPGSINPPPLEIGLERGARSFRAGLVGIHQITKIFACHWFGAGDFLFQVRP